ncbi:MAG: mechanosensitive ion channel family protein [Pseudomonadota bacterium]
MENLTEFIKSMTGLSPELQTKLLASVGIIFILLLLRTLTLRIVWRRTEDVRTRYLWRKTLIYIVVILSVAMVARVWFKGFQSIATFLGLVSAGLAIALKDLVANVAGWGFIIVRRPFTLGDRIQIGDYSGDVIDIRLFQFTLMEIGNWVDADQSTGRIMHIPNGKIFNETLANYSKGFQYIWNEIPVLITFESNWEKAKNILQDIINKHAEYLSKSAEARVKEASKKFMIFYTALTPTIYTNVKDSGVLLTIRYLCAPRNRRGTAHAIWEDILQEFAKCTDIDFAYPTQRFYNNRLEKKAETEKSSDEENINPSEE